jgi:hypothetical protein
MLSPQEVDALRVGDEVIIWLHGIVGETKAKVFQTFADRGPVLQLPGDAPGQTMTVRPGEYGIVRKLEHCHT